MSETVNESVINLNRVMNNYNLLQIRLDTSQVIESIKMYLNAEIEIVKSDGNSIKRETISIGIPKANKKGIAAILTWISMTINPQVVQGNFIYNRESLRSDMYEQYIEEFQKDLGDIIYGNLYAYDIEEDESQGIIDSIMNLVKPFMTRLIGNKERESYGETFKEVYTPNGNANPKGIMGLFKGQ